MTENPDQTMSRRGMPGDVEQRDLTPEVTPEDFDHDAFLAGVRPTRRGIRIFERADLIEPLERLADEIEHMPDGPECDAKIDEFEATAEEFRRASKWYAVQGHSREWEKDFREKYAAKHKLDPGTWGERTTSPDEARARSIIITAQLAEQIIGDVSMETLDELGERNAGELAKMLVLMESANTEVAEGAKVLTLDFSRRRSGKRDPGRRS